MLAANRSGTTKEKVKRQLIMIIIIKQRDEPLSTSGNTNTRDGVALKTNSSGDIGDNNIDEAKDGPDGGGVGGLIHGVAAHDGASVADIVHGGSYSGGSEDSSDEKSDFGEHL